MNIDRVVQHTATIDIRISESLMNIDRVVQHTATIDIRISESLEES